MAAEATEIPTAPAVQENTNDAGAETKTDVETTNQTNGHSDLTAADQTKPAEDSKPTEEAKDQEALAEDKPEEPKVGDKREHETSTTEPAETEKPAAEEESSEPTTKKQKTDEDDTRKAENGTAAPKEETNGEENKKKGGRGKKAKTPAAKPTVATDGPGSRTRSRTKAAA